MGLTIDHTYDNTMKPPQKSHQYGELRTSRWLNTYPRLEDDIPQLRQRQKFLHLGPSQTSLYVSPQLAVHLCPLSYPLTDWSVYLSALSSVNQIWGRGRLATKLPSFVANSDKSCGSLGNLLWVTASEVGGSNPEEESPLMQRSGAVSR